MPYSSPEGKRWILQRVKENVATSFLDVGAGAGYYLDIIKPHIGRPSFWAALEVWHPYVSQFRLTERYNEVICADARTWFQTARTNAYDVVILGDLLEHMTKEEAAVLWRDALRVAKVAVYISIPTVHYPQEAQFGNPHEAHVKDDWSVGEVLATFTGIVSMQEGQEVSVFEAPTW